MRVSDESLHTVIEADGADTWSARAARELLALRAEIRRLLELSAPGRSWPHDRLRKLLDGLGPVET